MKKRSNKLILCILGLILVNAIIALIPIKKSTIFVIAWIVLNILCLAAIAVIIKKKEDTEQIAHKFEKQTAAATADIKSLRAKAESLCASVDDPENQKALKLLTDELRFSDPVSNKSTASYDSRLSTLLESIAHHQTPAERNELIRRAISIAKERAAVAKASK